MPYRKDETPPTYREQLNAFTVDELKKLAKLFSSVLPTRKAELIDVIVSAFTGDALLRSFWERLDPLQQAAVAETIYAEPPVFDTQRFQACHGKQPDWGTASQWGHFENPTPLRALMPNGMIARDMQTRLKAFAAPPSEMMVPVTERLPEYIEISRMDVDWQTYKRKQITERRPLVVAHTERTAQHDLRAVLRRIDARRLAIGPKTRRAGKTVLEEVGQALSNGDFYSLEYRSDGYYVAPGPIRAFAWPMILQSGALVEMAGSRLQLTASGRKALTESLGASARSVASMVENQPDG